MAGEHAAENVLAFGPFWLDKPQRLLLCDGAVVALEPKVSAVTNSNCCIASGGVP
jgi:hypothetical protein